MKNIWFSKYFELGKFELEKFHCRYFNSVFLWNLFFDVLSVSMFLICILLWLWLVMCRFLLLVHFQFQYLVIFHEVIILKLLELSHFLIFLLLPLNSDLLVDPIFHTLLLACFLYFSKVLATFISVLGKHSFLEASPYCH